MRAPFRARIVRFAVFTVILFFLFYQLARRDVIDDLPAFGTGTGAAAGSFAQHERYMNDPSFIPRISLKKSSFAWDSVKFKYPPRRAPALPKRSKSAPHLPRIQHRFGPETPGAAKIRKERQETVKALFKKNWSSYKKYAWGKDALKPLSAGYVDQFSGWAATLVDSLDTLWIMGLRDEFYEAVQTVAAIDFGNSTSSRVNMFETNIRYLGGLLAAYDLSKHEALLAKATEVGDLLYAGFNTEHNMPVDFIDFPHAKTGKALYVEGSVVSASPGTLSLEFTHLSQVTGDDKYYAAVSKVMEVFYSQQNDTRLPGMWPMFISMNTMNVSAGYQFSIGGNADSMYEYLPKEYAMLEGAEPMYEHMSRPFMETARKYLFFRPMLPGEEDILISGNVDVDGDGNASLDPESEHLSCFIGGLFALGGRLFENKQYVQIGEKLARGCMYAYSAMPTGMMPERYNMVICKDYDDCPWDENLWDEQKVKRPQYVSHLPKGFTTAKDPRYILRPEAIESVFVLYRITGKSDFQEAAWDMFQAVAKGTATPYANAAVLDVTQKADKLPQEDYMESFWLAETMKYFYLCFSPPDLISLDDFVLNTEAHPFRRAK